MSSQSPQPTRPTIMMVEDEELITLFAREALHSAGFDLIGFSRGLQALEHLQAQPLVCAIVDVGLPDVRGDDLVRQIRRQQRTLPIILSTGYSPHDFEASFAADSCLKVLPKPYNEQRLLYVVEQLLARPVQF